MGGHHFACSSLLCKEVYNTELVWLIVTKTESLCLTLQWCVSYKLTMLLLPSFPCINDLISISAGGWVMYLFYQSILVWVGKKQDISWPLLLLPYLWIYWLSCSSGKDHTLTTSDRVCPSLHQLSPLPVHWAPAKKRFIYSQTGEQIYYRIAGNFRGQ